jgi:hypothetical protein
VENNVEWCDVVCRTHEIEPVIAGGVWCSPVRTPPLYPDAITMVPGCRAEDVLDGVDLAEADCSIKDSFADLDLADHGFEVLFEASWVARARDATEALAVSRSTITWEPVVDGDGFARWEQAQRREGDGPPGVLLATLLDRPLVHIWQALAKGRVVAGAVLFGRDPIGLSNVFGPDGDEGGELADEVWRSLVAASTQELGTVALVGYESGAALVAAEAAGLRAVGDLRVWIAS